MGSDRSVGVRVFWDGSWGLGLDCLVCLLGFFAWT
jgi:hypothetical protein